MEQDDKLALLQAQRQATYETLQQVYVQMQKLEQELLNADRENQRLQALLDRGLQARVLDLLRRVKRRWTALKA